MIAEVIRALPLNPTTVVRLKVAEILIGRSAALLEAQLDRLERKWLLK